MEFTPSYNEITDFDLFKRDSIPGYTILNEIGKGATGIVYSARSNKTGELVAIKVLFPHYSKNREYLRRVTREAELTRRLKHKNAVTGYEFGCANDHFYFVMEYVPGKTLAQILKEKNKLPERQVAEIILQVAHALKAAHKLKIIHRDIKPSNIAITPDNVIKLMDFGLAKEELDTSITVHGTILGTPCYISPEQARGEINVDIRSDIYSLGITAYHALVGEPPFCEFNTTLMLTKKTTDPVPSPKIKNPELSDEISYIVEKMCERDVEQRYPDPDALIKDIEDYLAGRLKIPLYKREQPIPAVSERELHQTQEQIVRELAQKITDSAVRELLSRDPLPGKPLFLESGKVLFYEGSRSREAYVLLQGELEVMKAGRRIASINESGAFVGEMATLLECTRTATVRALRNSVLLQITEEDFQYFLQSAPALAFRLAKNLARHLHATTTKLKALQSRITAIRNYFQLISEELHEQ